MASIVERTVDGEISKRIAIAGEQILRTMEIEDDWNHLRVGIRLAIDTTLATVPNPPPIYFGLTSGTTNNVGDVQTDHFIGVKTNSNNWVDAPFSVNTYPYALYCFFSTCYISNSIETENEIGAQDGSSGSPIIHKTSGGAAYPEGGNGAIYIDFVKNNNDIKISLYSISRQSGSSPQNTANKNVHLNRFNLSMQYVIPDNSNSDRFYLIGETTYTVDETTNGVFDTINIFWQGSTFAFEINDIAYNRFK